MTFLEQCLEACPNDTLIQKLGAEEAMHKAITLTYSISAPFREKYARVRALVEKGHMSQAEATMALYRATL